MSSSSTSPARRRIFKGAMALGVAPAIVGSARAQEKVTWRCQSHYPEASASFRGSQAVMARELEERTGGRFKIELLGAGTIANGAEIYNSVRRGVIPMGSTFPGFNLGESELFGLYSGVPGTLQEPWQMTHWVKNLGLEDAVNESMASKDVVFRAHMSYPMELCLKEQLEPDTNLGGLKVASFGTILNYLDGAGFAAQSISGGELYQALATGVLDGANWGAAQGHLSMKLWEVAPVQMKPALAIVTDVFVINKKAFDELPDDLRIIFDGLLQERYLRRTAEYTLGEVIAINTGVDKMGVTVQRFPDVVMEKFAGASRKILASEMEKGPLAREQGEVLKNLLGQLGYA